MFYLDHCKRAIQDQIQVLWSYQAEVPNLDYEFIRNHALSIYQFCTHIRNLSGLAEDPTLVNPIDRGDVLNIDHCQRALKEQIEMLWTYQNESEEMDYDFVHTHALYIIQFSEQLKRVREQGRI